MPGLSPGTKIYYNLVKKLTKALATFLDLHWKAGKCNDTGHFHRANQARLQVEIAWKFVYDQYMISIFPLAIKEKIEYALERVYSALENNPAYPEENELVDPQKSPSIVPEQIIKFPESPRPSDTETYALLQREYNDTIAELLAFEEQSRERRRKFHYKCQQL